VEQLRVPTLVLWGDLDLPHLQLRCQTLVQRIPGAQRVVLEGTAHLPGLEAPARFNTALAAWLATTKVAP
jgi:pimeloyl-ACP methyl ester carboxylesterase